MAEDDGLLIWRNLHEIAGKVCKHFRLSYARIEPELSLRKRDYGETAACDRCWTRHMNGNGNDVANCSDKIIKLRIHQKSRPNSPLALRTIVDTLAHELAHLRPECWEHGAKHKAFTKEILAFIREIGYTW